MHSCKCLKLNVKYASLDHKDIGVTFIDHTISILMEISMTLRPTVCMDIYPLIPQWG